MAQHIDGGGPDWGAIGAAVVALAGGVAGAVGWRRSIVDKGVAPVGAIVAEADGDDRALAVLRGIITSLQDDIARQREENTRLWNRNKIQDGLYETLEARCGRLEAASRELRVQIVQLRARLVKAGIDPGEGDVT